MKYYSLTMPCSTRVQSEYNNRTYLGIFDNEPKLGRLEKNKKARERYKKQKL